MKMQRLLVSTVANPYTKQCLFPSNTLRICTLPSTNALRCSRQSLHAPVTERSTTHGVTSRQIGCKSWPQCFSFGPKPITALSLISPNILNRERVFNVGLIQCTKSWPTLSYQNSIHYSRAFFSTSPVVRTDKPTENSNEQKSKGQNVLGQQTQNPFGLQTKDSIGQHTTGQQLGKPETNGLEATKKKPGLFQRFKDAYKEYGKTLIAFHLITSTFWFGGFYYIAYSGLDVVSVLTWLHFPEGIIEKVEKSNAGNLAMAYLLYEIAKPVRTVATLWGTQLTVKHLRKLGYMAPRKEQDKLKVFAKEGRDQMIHQKNRIKRRMVERRELYRFRFRNRRDRIRRSLRYRQDNMKKSFQQRRDRMRQSLATARISFERRFGRKRVLSTTGVNRLRNNRLNFRKSLTKRVKRSGKRKPVSTKRDSVDKTKPS